MKSSLVELRKRILRHALLWLVAGFAVAGGICCDSKGPNPPLMILAGFALVGTASTLGLWLAWADRTTPNGFFRVTFGGVTVWILMFFAVSAIVTPVFKSARAASDTTICISNVKQLGLGLLIYSNEFDDHLPPAKQWRSLTVPDYVTEGEGGDCPLTDSKYDFAMNWAVSGRSTVDIDDPSRVPMLFESTTNEANASGGPEDVAYRHRAAVVVLDGTARRLDRESVEQLNWKGPVRAAGSPPSD